MMLKACLSNINILKSIPTMNIEDQIIIETDKGMIQFDINKLPDYNYSGFNKENYNLEIDDNIAIITYNSCRDEEKMIKLIEKLKNLSDVDNYIIDLRGNGGGNSLINKHLVDFMEDKNVVVLSDERVFSSARMCIIDLKKIGAKIIGTPPATPISCFGNNIIKKSYPDMKLKFTGSTVYWYYDESLKHHGVEKKDWEDAIKKYPNLLEPVFVDVDEEVELTIDDYINLNDPVLKRAKEIIRNTKTL